MIYVFCRRTLVLALSIVPAALCAETITFEGLTDGTILTTQYPGVTFSNTVILTAGITLNEFEFPPHSGINVATDAGGPMSICSPIPFKPFLAISHTLSNLTSRHSQTTVLCSNPCTPDFRTIKHYPETDFSCARIMTSMDIVHFENTLRKHHMNTTGGAKRARRSNGNFGSTGGSA